LVAAWDADSMDDTFTGGIWFAKPPEGTAWPYVRVTDLGDALRYLTSGTEAGQAQFREHAFQVAIWHKDDETNDPVVELGALMRTFDSFVQDHNRTLFSSATEGCIYSVDNVAQRILEGEDDQTYQGQLDYRARRTKLVTA
jgi:hypothetical protein